VLFDDAVGKRGSVRKDPTPSGPFWIRRLLGEDDLGEEQQR
jgi:hypothetical protein